MNNMNIGIYDINTRDYEVYDYTINAINVQIIGYMQMIYIYILIYEMNI